MNDLMTMVEEMLDLQSHVHQAEMDERRKREDGWRSSDPAYQKWSEDLSQKAIEEKDKCEE